MSYHSGSSSSSSGSSGSSSSSSSSSGGSGNNPVSNTNANASASNTGGGTTGTNAAGANRSYSDITGARPVNTDPVHTDPGTGRTDMPGVRDLRDVIDANTEREIRETWQKDWDKEEARNRYSVNNPHISEPYSDLEALIFQALRRYGDMHPGTVDGEVMLMFVEFANLVIEDLRGHAYWDNPEIDYYTHPQQQRAIPDSIMVSGLLYHYSVQQQSNKIEAYGPMYFKMMNRILYQRKYGSGPIEMSPWDKSVTPTGSQPYDARRDGKRTSY